MALTLTRKGAFKILAAYFDGGAVPTSHTVYLYTSGTVLVTTATTTGFTQAANYTQPVLTAATNLSTFEGVGSPSNMATSELTITFTGATAAITGYMLVDNSANVIAWDTFSPTVTSAGSGDTLKLTINPFNLA